MHTLTGVVHVLLRIIAWSTLNCMLEYEDIIQAHCYGFKSSKVIIDN